jgi:hypothetical protein
MRKSLISKVEIQTDLIERINNYRHKRGVASDSGAVEALIRIGLFIDAAPKGSILIGYSGDQSENSGDNVQF